MSRDDKLKTYLTEEDVKELIQKAACLRDEIIIRLLFYTGCKVSELLNIKIANIDFNQGHIVVKYRKSLARRECPSCGKKASSITHYCPGCGEKMQASNPKEVHRCRTLPLKGASASMVRDYLDRRSVQSDLLIPLCRQYVDIVIKNAAYNAGFGGKLLFNPEGKGLMHHVSAQTLREAHNICFLKMPTPKQQKALQQQLGHVTFGTTKRYIKRALHWSK